MTSDPSTALASVPSARPLDTSARGGASKGPLDIARGRQATSHRPYLTRDPIDVAEWHAEVANLEVGASVEFLGIVRGDEDGRPIAALDYEAYEPMAQRLMARCVEEAVRRWPLHHVVVRHRLGRVPVGQVAVLIGVQAPHRTEAFEACRVLLETIKQDVPIWKTAIGTEGMTDAA